MTIKDLFGKKSNKLVTSQDSENISNEVESKDLVREEVTRRNTFVPKSDFNDPKNFVFHGSAKKYYEDSIANIYNTYPYDGSEAEQIKWENEATYLDNYLLKNGYPRTTGHVKLNTSYSVLETLNVPATNENFITSQVPQFVYFEGDPKIDSADAAKGLSNLFGDSKTNIYNSSKGRTSNLNISHSDGNTVEFWFKVPAASLTNHSVSVFDMYNQLAFGHSDYGRILIEIIGTSNGTVDRGAFNLTYKMGTKGVERINVADTSAMPSGWSYENWHHYAFVFKADSANDKTIIKFYVDGNLVSEKKLGTAIVSSYEQDWQAMLGAYVTGPFNGSFAGSYVGTSQQSCYDEFRFWKTARTEKNIKRNWFKQVRGGTNTDDANVKLGVYYKFNEGIVNTTAVDSADAKVLDYSGRINNADIINYDLSVRSTDSALTNEHKDPIVRSNNSLVVEYKNSMISKGELHDLGNYTSIMNSIPKWITDIDERNDSNTLKHLIQIISSYFDTLQLQIQSLPEITNLTYDSMESGSYPHHFIREAVGSAGMINPDLFIEANVLEEISSRNEKSEYESNIQDVKNVIYQNIYNNLPYIYKSKGTEKSFRNLIRCFGIDDELLKIKMYADSTDFTFNDGNSISKSLKKNYANFNNTGSFDSVVYQAPDSTNSDSVGFIKNQTSNLDFVPYTAQCEVLFPKKYSNYINEPFIAPFTEVSLFGLHGANTSSPNDTTFPTDDAGNFQVYFVKESENAKGGKFRLDFSGSTSISLTSSIIKDVYDNEKWNLAVRLYPSGTLDDYTSGSAEATTYKLEFYGVNTVSNVVQNEFSLSSAIDTATARKILNKSKRMYVGARRTNITGSVLSRTDVYASSARFWLDYLDNETIRYHSQDASSYGRLEPNKPTHFTVTSLTGSTITQSDTLVLNWKFDNILSSDSSGEFTVLDCSSGSNFQHGWFENYSSKHHTGKGFGFPANYGKSIIQKHVETRKLSQPESLSNSDMVKILTQDDEVFTRDTIPIKHHFAVEKSMYQVISDEMIRVFAGLRYFNDLVGHPINRYRIEYKDLRNLRQMFFTKVENSPSLEKYVEFYKWIDSSIGSMIGELFPVSANYTSDVRTMVESHMLERNKYWNKFPTIEQKDREPNGQIIASPAYSWQFGHSPVSDFSGTTNTLYGRERIERTDPRVTSGDANVDADRESIRKAILRNAKGNSQLVGAVEKGTRLYDDTSSQIYEASTYVSRHLSKPYSFSVELQNSIKGGPNKHINKLPSFESIRAVTEPGLDAGVKTVSAVVNNNSEDNAALHSKFKADSIISEAQTQKSKGSLVNPFSEYADTVTGTPKVTNNLFDSYGKDGETPAQGPFTDTHVGGSQHRHVELNLGSDNSTNRAELYIDSDASATINTLRHPNYSSSAVPSARYFRDELAKRPVNIRNIKFDSSSKTIGNYSKDYQVVSAPGRSSQNRWFYKNNGTPAFTTSQASNAIIGVNDYTLPDRTTDSLGNNFGTSDHVIVQRFSAPGGPESISRRGMDGESEEFSSYSSMNYRNLLTRNFLNSKHRTHSGQQGYVEGTLTGSYHKMQRNTAKKYVKSGSGVAEKLYYDNFFVTHQIPRSLYQYSWINNSSDGTSLAGYSSKFLNVQSTASISTSGSLEVGVNSVEIDYVGLNSTVYDPFSIKHLSTGYPNEFFLDKDKHYVHQFLPSPGTKVDKAKQLNALLLHRDGPHQYPSWKQIRVGEKPIARRLRKENMVVVHNDVVSSNQDGSYSVARTTDALIEPAVTWNIPLESHIKPSSDSDEPYRVIHSYRNNLEVFANPNISNLLNPVKTRVDERKQPYDKLFNLYSDGSVALEKLVYSENIFPKHRNAGLKRTRSRVNYAESEDTLRKSPGVIRTFWRSGQNDRIKPNRSSNALDTKFSPEQLDSLKQLDSFWALDNFEFNIGNNKYQVLGDLSYVGIKRYRSWITGEFLSHQASPYTQIGATSELASQGAYNSRGQSSQDMQIFGYQNSDYSESDISEQTGYKYPSDELISRNNHLNESPDSAAIPAVSMGEMGDSNNPVEAMAVNGFNQNLSVEPTFSLDDTSDGGGELSITAPITDGFMVDNGYTLSDNESSIDGILTPIVDFGIPTDLDDLINSDGTTTINPGSPNVMISQGGNIPPNITKPVVSVLSPRPAIQFYHQPHHTILGESGMRWNTANLSGKYPWYDTYENYSEEIQKMGQNYSTIPEFRISKHLPFYVQNEKGNFNSDNYAFLTLEGSGDNKPEHDSADKKVKFKKFYSRDGFGADDIKVYPSSSEDPNTNNIQNNAWYIHKHPDGNTSYTTYKNFNNMYASGSFTIDNSVMTIYNITKTLPTNEQNSSGNDWKSISPYMTRNSGVNLNTSNANDFLYSNIERVNSSGTTSLSLQQENSQDPGTPFCISFWVNLSKDTQDSRYVGAWNISMGDEPDEWIGMWLKAPKADDWAGSTSTRGITVFTSFDGNHPSAGRKDTSVLYKENIYEFFNADGTEAVLTPGTMYHVTFEYVPRGATGGSSPAYMRVFLNGQKLYGKHIKYANQDTANSGIAYSAVPIGESSTWNEPEIYGDAPQYHGFGKLNNLQVGRSNPEDKNNAQYYQGFMDEFSMWYGTLSSADVTRLNYYGQPSNLIEEYANSEVNGTLGSWEDEFGATAPIIGTDGGVSYTRPVSKFTFKTLELFQWSRLGVPFSVRPESLQVDYSDRFFDKYTHTDFIKYFDKITDEHKGMGHKTKLRLKVNAIKKLLPYNGFYPSQRTTQMAYLFKESYKDSITLTNVNAPYNKEGLHRSQAFQSLLQPFFAPGLLFNSLKSGIAVDWPIFTNNSGREPSRPFPIIDAFDKQNNYEPRKFNIAAPSWYIEQELDSSTVGEYGVSYDPRHINTATAAFEKSQPKYSLDEKYGADNEGFIIIKEPSSRLDFEKLLDIESAFYNEGSLGHKVGYPVEKDAKVFQNVVVEFRGYECEGNTIILRQPVIREQKVIGFEDISIHIAHDNSLDFNNTRIEKTRLGATIYVNFLETQEAEISSILAEEVLKYINGNIYINFIAVSSVVGSTDPINNSFAYSEEQVSDISSLGNFADYFRIKLIYVGPLELTVEDYVGQLDTELEMIYNMLNTTDPALVADIDFSLSGEEINKKIRLPKLFYVASGFGSSMEDYYREETFFTTHSKCLHTSGFGKDAKISFEDSGVTKSNGVSGILGIRYVNEAGSTSSESDSTNYTPMLQTLRPFYGGRALTDADMLISETISVSDLKIKKKPHQVFLMAPTYYTGSVETDDWYRNTRFPFFEWKGKSSNPLYKMAMHNFLAETPKFFLKNRGMTTIASSPQNKFKKMKIGQKYYMDVVLYSEGVKTTHSPYDGQILTQYPGSGDSEKEKRSTFGRTQGRYYGYPYKTMDNEYYLDSGQLIADPAYAPNTPPYFYGKSTARISYTADRENPTIADIHRDMKVEYVDDEILQKFVMTATTSSIYDPARLTSDVEKYGIKNSPAYKARMKLEASVNLKAITRLKNVSYDVTDSTLDSFNPVSATDSNTPEDDVWVITPKFESPVLNFDPASTNNSASLGRKDMIDQSIPNAETYGTGLWHGYGQVPSGNKGIFIALEESFKTSGESSILDEPGEEIGSLIEVCGFRTEVSRIGEVADERQVSEAVIMIPFVDNIESGKAETVSVIGKNFFKINKDKYNYQKSNMEKGLPAVQSGDYGATSNIQETSISRMAKLMKKYNIPPKFDFTTYNGNPFVMYIFEFNHTFDQQDLSDIWQGVLPKIGTNARYSDEEDDNEIVHDLGPHDFFEGQEMPKNIRWMVFKVKQKGEKNFFNITADSRDDDRFKFDFQVGNKTPEYSYNWPYDYFSLVELANIEGGIIIEPDEE